ncbi:MAG: ATP-binding protein [Cyanobacteria bacterium J06648_10]
MCTRGARSASVPSTAAELSALSDCKLIAKEGLINVQKHAKATTATLLLEAKEDEVVLTLTDNGCGFEPVEMQKGYGLQGIKERSQLLGGQLTVNLSPAHGTHLQVVVPLNRVAT